MLGPISHRYGPLYPPDRLRPYGTHIVADIGSGKSTLLGRGMAFIDFLRRVPTIVFDNGDTIDHFLQKVTLLPEPLRKDAWKRIRYVDLAGNNGHIVPFPLYFRFGTESNLTVAKRFVRTIQLLDPNLRTASVQGLNAIKGAALPAGVLLAEKGLQITELEQVWKTMPESLRIQLIDFQHDDTLKAMYAANTPGINWQEVIDKKQIVLIDYRNLEDPQFALVWVFQYLLAFIIYRGRGLTPISIIVDELSSFKEASSSDDVTFFREMNILLKTTMRRYNLWLTLGHQYMGQFDERVQDLLLSMDVQIIGKSNSMRSARTLSQQFARIDPYKIKRTRPQFGSQSYYAHPLDRAPIHDYFILNEEPVEFSAVEQHLEQSYEYQDLPRLSFMVYGIGDDPVPWSIKRFEPQVRLKNYEKSLTAIREKLMQRDGRPITEVLAEINARTQKQGQSQPQNHEPAIQQQNASKLTYEAEGDL